ncbi:UNKNOWN [Stylonychia lemnae]|uniref:Morn repeat protein n=1 Tax=Stylonychia lemnae TaxID=5949 RepID=A0A078A9L4_STYLE|nr:UNKNOWN [Stylonychia lemnae]|eukprot:CDW77488.1 UNKNOWN [Stylonychia lemnae]
MNIDDNIVVELNQNRKLDQSWHDYQDQNIVTDQQPPVNQTPTFQKILDIRRSSNMTKSSVIVQDQSNNLQNFYKAEKEDDMGQQQQVSGGFGDSQELDEETIQQMLKQQQQKILAYQSLTYRQKQLSSEKSHKNKWEDDTITEDYQMESTTFQFEEIRKNESFGIKKYADAIYRGEIVNGKRSGRGIMLYKKNRVYEGEWVNDVRQGKGYERYQNSNKYEGDFFNGKAHGKGVYSWANGEIYDGEWKIGVKDGYGIWKGVFGDSYIGEWKNSKADGYGVHQWKNGDRYEGEWQTCLKHGQGTDIFANGDSYTGQYTQGKPDGQGQYKWKNGSVYIGEFKDGLKHGRGKWRKLQNVQNCNSYDGEYQYDKKNGYGVFTWESGNVYKGNYKDDERDGYGEMFWIDGSYYQGEWRRGIQHGQGKMTFPDGSIKEGLFENNVYQQQLQVQTIQSPIIIAPKQQQISDEVSLIVDEKATLSPNGSVIESKSVTSRSSNINIRAISRGKNASIIRQITGTSNLSFQTNFKKAPDFLNPVQPPIKKEQLNTSNEYDYGYGGYSSPGQDSDSTRVSNILYSKMSVQKPYTNRDQVNLSMMQKPGNIKMALINQQALNNSSNQGYHSNNEQASFLPEIKRVFSKSSQRTQVTQLSDQRRASPEAIALMMNNLKNNKQNKHWVPGGTNGNKEDLSKIKKIVF